MNFKESLKKENPGEYKSKKIIIKQKRGVETIQKNQQKWTEKMH